MLFGVKKNLLVRVLERLGVFFVFWGSICANQHLTQGMPVLWVRYSSPISASVLSALDYGPRHRSSGKFRQALEHLIGRYCRVMCDMPNSMHEVALSMGSSEEGGVAEQRGCSDNSG